MSNEDIEKLIKIEQDKITSLTKHIHSTNNYNNDKNRIFLLKQVRDCKNKIQKLKEQLTE